LPVSPVLAVLAGLAFGSAGFEVRAQVPYVPTPLDVVQRMLTMAKVSASDYLIDLGSGDGRVVREAARRYGARGLGVDLDPELVARSTELARQDGVADKVAFMAQDLFQTELGQATVVTMYLLPAVNMKLRPRLLGLAPGTRVVSHDFDLGDWQPDETDEIYSPEKFGGGNSKVYLWIVPADFSGRWQWRMDVAGQTLDYELRATQRFQNAEASVRVGGEPKKLEKLTLHGDAVSFTVVGEIKGSTVRQQFSGRIAGDTVQGTVILSGIRLQGVAEWSATRSERGFRSVREPAVTVASAARSILFFSGARAGAGAR